MESVRDRVYACVVLVLAASLSYATLTGITCSNDGSHYALVRAMVEGDGFEITPWESYAENSDFARVGGRTYSDRPPGTAFLAAPLYAVGPLLPEAPGLLPSRHDAQNPALIYVLLLPVLLGAWTVAGVFRLLRWWGVSPEAAFTSALVLACGTLFWRYSGVLFSHVVSGCLILSVFSLVVRSDGDKLRPLMAAAIGGMLGVSVLVEYSNLLYVAIVCLFLWSTRERLTQLWREPLTTALFAVALATPLALLMLYNARVFGGPLQHSYTETVTYPWTHSADGIFSGELFDGLKGMLFYRPGSDLENARYGEGIENQGIFWMSPVLLLAGPGYWFWARHHARRPLALALSTLGAYLVLFAMHRTYHAFTRDSRYFTPFLPLLALGVGFWLQRLFARTPNSPLQLLGYSLLFALFAWSVRNVASHIVLSFNHAFRYRVLRDIAVDPANVEAFFRSLFPNWKDLPRLWAVLVVGASPWFAWLRFAQMRPRLVEKDQKPLVQPLS